MLAGVRYILSRIRYRSFTGRYDPDDDDDYDDDDYDDDDYDGLLDRIPGIALEGNIYPRIYPELSPRNLEIEHMDARSAYPPEFNDFSFRTYLSVEDMTEYTKEHVYKLQAMVNDVNSFMERQDTQTRKIIENMKYGKVAA